MRTIIAPLPFALAVLAAPAVVMAQPSADERAEARRHFQTGVQRYQARDFAAALEAFRSAYRIAPHPSVRKNVAACYDELGRAAEAVTEFELFLSESPNVPAAERRAIETHLHALRRRTAEVTVSLTPAEPFGLAVTVDDAVVSIARPVRVNAGHHTLQVTANGYATTAREFDVAAGESQTLSLTLEAQTPVATPTPTPTATPPVPTPTPTPATGNGDASDSVLGTPPGGGSTTPGGDETPPPILPPPPREESHGLSPGVFYAVAGVTGAAAIAWGVCGALALSTNSDFDASVARVNTLPAGNPDTVLAQANAQQTADDARRWALWSDIAMGVTLAGAVAGTILFLKTDFGGHRVAVSAAPHTHGGALTLGGTF